MLLNSLLNPKAICTKNPWTPVDLKHNESQERERNRCGQQPGHLSMLVSLGWHLTRCSPRGRQGKNGVFSTFAKWQISSWTHHQTKTFPVIADVCELQENMGTSHYKLQSNETIEQIKAQSGQNKLVCSLGYLKFQTEWQVLEKVRASPPRVHQESGASAQSPPQGKVLQVKFSILP